MIFETFSRRQPTQKRKDEREIYTYDNAPEQLRIQIAFALMEGIGRYYVATGYELHNYPSNMNVIWDEIDRICAKEILSYTKLQRDSYIVGKFASYLQIAPIDLL